MPDIDRESLEFAIAREIEANRFYLAIAERVADPEIRKVIEGLAEEELEHKAKLEMEVMKLGGTINTDIDTTPVDYSRYIISNVDAPLDMDYKDVLLLAMEKEEASFRTYVNLIAMAKEKESREVLFGLAEEEVRHKLRFQTEYDLITKKKP